MPPESDQVHIAQNDNQETYCLYGPIDSRARIFFNFTVFFNFKFCKALSGVAYSYSADNKYM